MVDRNYLLEKTPGKGGWTYAAIPEILPDKNAHFGWVKVKGSIDGFEIRKHHLMPMGNGELGLSVNAGVRRKIKKQAGDHVHVILYPDNEPLEVPAELWLCLQDDPEALRFFNSLDESGRYGYVKWIYSAKNDREKVDRIAGTIDRLAKKQQYQ